MDNHQIFELVGIIAILQFVIAWLVGSMAWMVGRIAGDLQRIKTFLGADQSEYRE